MFGTTLDKIDKLYFHGDGPAMLDRIQRFIRNREDYIPETEIHKDKRYVSCLKFMITGKPTYKKANKYVQQKSENFRDALLIHLELYAKEMEEPLFNQTIVRYCYAMWKSQAIRYHVMLDLEKWINYYNQEYRLEFLDVEYMRWVPYMLGSGLNEMVINQTDIEFINNSTIAIELVECMKWHSPKFRWGVINRTDIINFFNNSPKAAVLREAIRFVVENDIVMLPACKLDTPAEFSDW